MPTILIIEPSRGIRSTLQERLEYESYHVHAAATEEEAAQLYPNVEPDVVLCDKVKGHGFQAPFIVVSDNISVENAVDSVRAGAFDFIPKPIDMNHLLGAVRKAVGIENTVSDDSGDPFQPRTVSRKPRQKMQEIVGESNRIRAVKDMIDRVAPMDAKVLVTGENGTGKELVARWLHEKSRRTNQPFVEINCAAIPSELIESELFGHEKGAFTSAVRQRKGKFEQANGGTLFMDEIGDMSLSAQAKVLRALQENRITRVGSEKDVMVDVRVIAATNKNLREEIGAGRFREDLYHRLSVVIINIPPLRDRSDDIPMLISHFSEQICREYGINQKRLSKESIDALCSMPWSGNIRELRNVIERLIILSGPEISLADVQLYVVEHV